MASQLDFTLALSLLFATAVALQWLLRVWLVSRQVRHVATHRSAVPPAFAHRISLSAHQKAADYTLAKAKVSLIDITLSAAVLLCWTLLGGLDWLNRWLLAFMAPGLWQRRWTFNGESVGPTLRLRAGDEVEITLINDGTMGHSIDFHAGAVAPDEPMRTIAPGETLIYRFTAERVGVWMYHCSTMPMSAHIAAGMHGTVIVEPAEGLPEVDREYVVVQSEVFTDDARSAEEATDIDPAKVSAEQIDRVVFNGVANQYDQEPFQAKVGERVRFYVLDAGPNRASSFHIVGGQFDTVFREGGYLIKDGVDAFGTQNAGSQALALQPAEGGFVELTFPEAGHYPVVSHIMIDAERGAHGIVEVTNP